MKIITTFISFLLLSNSIWSQTEEFYFHEEDSKIVKIKNGEAPIVHFPFELLYNMYSEFEFGVLDSVKTFQAISPSMDGEVEFIPEFRQYLIYNSSDQLQQVQGEYFNQKDWVPSSTLDYTYTQESLVELLTEYDSNGAAFPTFKQVHHYENDIVFLTERYILDNGEEILSGYDEYVPFNGDSNKITHTSYGILNGETIFSFAKYYLFLEGDQLFHKTDLDENGKAIVSYNYGGGNIYNVTTEKDIFRDADNFIEEIITYRRKEIGNGWNQLIEERGLGFTYEDNSLSVTILDYQLEQPIIGRYIYYFTPHSTVSNYSPTPTLNCTLTNPVYKNQQLNCSDLANASIIFHNEIGQVIGKTNADEWGNFKTPNHSSSGLVVLSALSPEGIQYHYKFIVLEE